ncbi:hypothetical protein AMTRI_Chr01g114180 [Amborella trichopoda]
MDTKRKATETEDETEAEAPESKRLHPVILHLLENTDSGDENLVPINIPTEMDFISLLKQEITFSAIKPGGETSVPVIISGEKTTGSEQVPYTDQKEEVNVLEKETTMTEPVLKPLTELTDVSDQRRNLSNETGKVSDIGENAIPGDDRASDSDNGLVEAIKEGSDFGTKLTDSEEKFDSLSRDIKGIAVFCEGTPPESSVRARQISPESTFPSTKSPESSVEATEVDRDISFLAAAMAGASNDVTEKPQESGLTASESLESSTPVLISSDESGLSVTGLEGSGYPLGYLLEASDDELGLPPQYEASMDVLRSPMAVLDQEWRFCDEMDGGLEMFRYSFEDEMAGFEGEDSGFGTLFDHSDLMGRQETMPAL